MAFNYLMDVGLVGVLQYAPSLTILDLEGNDMSFEVMSEAMELLW